MAVVVEPSTWAVVEVGPVGGRNSSLISSRLPAQAATDSASKRTSHGDESVHIDAFLWAISLKHRQSTTESEGIQFEGDHRPQCGGVAGHRIPEKAGGGTTGLLRKVGCSERRFGGA